MGKLMRAALLSAALLSCATRGGEKAFSGLSPEDAVKAMELPEGFKAELVAGEPDVVQPVAFDFDDRGRLWVAEFLSYPKWAPEGHDRIVLLENANGGGRLNKRTVVWDKGNYLTGFTLGYGGIWVTSPPNLLFLPCDFNADKPVVGAAQIVLDGWSHAGTHNIVNGLTWGPDGWLYGGNGISSRSRVGPPGCAESARTFIDGGIWRLHPRTKKLEQVCTGMTNPWGMDWDEYGELFVTNNVTAHLFHVLPGARFERSHESDQNPYTYELMGGIADHKHFEGAWTDVRKPGPHVDLGGGHSHSGAYICKNPLWPEKYRGTIFMFNTHGSRINNDKLELTPNGYVARHNPDFMLAHDPSFRGVAMKPGPDGALYISDWHQDGECHSGTEAGSGRIFKIYYGKLLPIQVIKNGKGPAATKTEWSMQQERRKPYIGNPIDHVELSTQLLEALKHLMEVSALERMHLVAEIMQEPWPLAQKKELLTLLARRPEMAANKNERLMLWYAIEPLVEPDPVWAYSIFRETKSPELRQFTARRLSEHKVSVAVELLKQNREDLIQLDALKGITAALKGRFKVEAPAGWIEWQELAARGTNKQIQTLTLQLAAVFGDAASLDELRKIALDKKADVSERRNALQSLLDARDDKVVPLLQKLVRDLDLRRDALRALARFSDPQTPLLILQLYPNFDAQEKADALNTLAARPENAALLLKALKAGMVQKMELNAAHVRALEAYDNSEINAWIKENWGSSRKTAEDKLADIARLKKLVESAPPGSADTARGREVFKKTCIACHTLFGEGGKAGPDLTGSARNNLDYLLQNIVDPNAIVAQEYMAWSVKTNDGRVLNGIVRNETERTLDLITGAETITLHQNDIKLKQRSGLSLMPEGILNAIKEPEILDLLAYLRSR